jgi:hypothetical protein
MSTSKTMNEILADTKQFLSIKEASFGKQAKEEALDNPNSIPGSAHDKPVDDGASAPDKEVQQELPPNTANSNAGATEAEKLESGHATDATQAVQDVAKKPMVSSDSNAKEASAGVNAHAQDLIDLIGNFNSEKTAARSAVDVLTDEKCSKCDKEDCDCEKEDDSDDSKEASQEESKEATVGGEIELSRDVLAKIACTILSTEEGVNFTETILQKEAGAQAARDTMEFLNKQAEDSEKQAAYDAGQEHADQLINEAVKQAEDARFEQAYEAGRNDAIKLAQATSPDGSIDYKALGATVAAEAVKRAQAELMGMDPAAMDSGIGADEALAGMAGEGEEAGDDIAPEELEAALAMMVQSGELSEEEVAAIMSQIGASEGAEEAGEAVGAIEGAAPEGLGELEGLEGLEEAPAGMEVAASASVEKSFLNALATVRANSK